jgi:hypothetical protein
MLISYSKKFIFVHIYKVAGSSIRAALNKYQYPPHENYFYHLLKRVKWLPSDQTLHSHSKARDIKKAVPERYFNSSFKFAFVRNPWDWQVSLYFYALQDEQHPQHQLTKNFSGFEEYLEWRVSEDLHLQKEFVTDEKDRLLVNFVGKIENLEDDFNYVCKQLGVEESLPHKNVSQHEHYKNYYNEKTRKLVAQHFKKDIELFDYSF